MIKHTTATIKVSAYTKPVTKQNLTQSEAIAAATAFAVKEDADVAILPMVDAYGMHAGWQGWQRRRNASGASAPHEYVQSPDGRRARRVAINHQGGRVLLVEVPHAPGPVDAEVVFDGTNQS